MRKNSVKGTSDFLPKDMRIRDYLVSTILSVYQANGFERIGTPILEDIENLDNSDGGENLNLIFKVMKRGEKLKDSLAKGDFDDLADMGLRYDLTLPLARYYAAHRNELNSPFKVIQIGDVFRAERPQKGRMRQFMQCDIDTLNASDISAEIELLDICAKALLAIGISNFKFRINDRRILNSMLESIGFPQEALQSVCISFDKLDKIGMDGVAEELIEKGMPAGAVDKLTEIVSAGDMSPTKVKEYCSDPKYAEDVERIIESMNIIANDRFEIEFDMSLVRGQGYYTGTVFEVESLDFGSSIAGGGRYDNMIGKFLGEKVPAVGISIGFERIVSILSERGGSIGGSRPRYAVVFGEGEIVQAIKKADELRADYDVALFARPNKPGKLFAKLEAQGFKGCYVLGADEPVKEFQGT